MEKKKSFFKRKSLWWILGIILISVFVVLGLSRGGAVTYETEVVARGPIIETVNVTGQIKPENSAVLRFKISGIVSGLNVDVGDKVTRGQLLASLDSTELQKELTRREAELNSADVILKNARQEKEDTLIRNNQALSKVLGDAPKNFSDILNLAEKINTVITSFYSDENGDILQSIQESVQESSLIATANDRRFFTERAMADLRESLQNLSTKLTTDKIEATILEIENPLRDIQSSLTIIINLINGVDVGVRVSQTELDAYKTTLTTAQADINTALSKEITLARDLEDALINANLNNNTADSTIRLRAAEVETVRAAMEIAKQNINDAYLYSPISGTIATRSKELGELVSTNDEVYFVIGDGDLEVTANIPEVDIGLVKKGARVDATLDALGTEDHFAAWVESIDPDKTTIDGVVYYKTHIFFEEIDPRFKSGMSVNLDIVVEEKENAIIVSRRALDQRGSVTSVKVFQGEGVEPEVREVRVGLRGEVEVEILSGVGEGEVIIVGEK